MEVRNAGMQGQKFLRSSRFPENQLTLLLFSGRAVGLSWAERYPRRERTPEWTPLLPYGACSLFNQVITARRRDHLEVLHGVEHWKGSNGRPATPQLIGVNNVWDAVVHQQAFEKGLGHLRIPVRLQQDI